MFFSSDEMLRCPQRPTVMIERKWKSNVELEPNCPRCASSNTKFCYYNNYSLSQPRYFCKGCRRYWTKGGSLRNVPVGGGCRKNRRGKSVRLPPTTTTSEQVSMSYSHKSVLGDSCVLADGNLTHSPAGTGESDIDLSVVFAKFLNQNSSLDPELPDEIDASFNLSNHDSNSMLEFPNELIEGTSREVLGEFDQVYDHEQQQQLKIPQFMGSDLNGYGLQSLLNDNVVEDALWSDTQAMPNFTWQQQPEQLQGGLEPIMADDHFSFHPNLLNNNWTSFDL